MNNKNFSAITIDVETDWGGRQASNSSICKGIDEGLPKILSLLERYNFLATFFVSASLAEKRPGFVSFLEKKGHEIASHGYDHNINYTLLSKSQHLYQLQKSKDILESQIGKRIDGFRSPQFRIHPEFFYNLLRAGYIYDSSIVCTSLLNRYSFQKEYFKKAEQYNIKEIPVTTITVLNIPFGLLWMNKFGHKTCMYMLKYPRPKNNLYIMYCHPFDFVLEKKYDIKVPLLIKACYNWQKYSVENTFDILMSFMEGHCKVETMRKIAYPLRNNA